MNGGTDPTDPDSDNDGLPDIAQSPRQGCFYLLHNEGGGVFRLRRRRATVKRGQRKCGRIGERFETTAAGHRSLPVILDFGARRKRELEHAADAMASVARRRAPSDNGPAHFLSPDPTASASEEKPSAFSLFGRPSMIAGMSAGPL